MGTQTISTDTEFSSLQFEKILTGLKDSQESINSCCHWCLNHRQHYKKIVNVWLNVIKRVKIEQRLTLFYLANDVVQYSKRRNYDYVETWGTAIQKATTLVRDDKVKNKILRIFKIWEQRGVYGEEFITDLCGLISIQPTGPKNDEPHEFQPSYVINKIKNCSNLEKDTDTKLKVLKEHNPKIQISEGLINSLKDRANTDDVEKEVDVYVQHMENYINALKLEIKNRIALITVLKQAEGQLESDRKDVKMVAHAYRTFGQRVKVFQKKLEERMENLPSPIPSPDINAPSPSPEEDLDLPDDTPTNNSADNSIDFSATIQYTNPGFYVPPPVTSVINSTMNSTMNNTTVSHNTSTASDNISFLSNGFTSFLGSNLSFDVSNISATGIFPNSITEHSTVDNTQTTNSYVTTPTPVLQPSMPVLPGLDLNMDNTSSAVYNPLLPPPMPPFSKNNDTGAFSFTSNMEMNANNSYAPTYEPPSYSEATYSTETGMNNSGITDSNHYEYQIQTGINPYPPSEEKYDPSQVTDTWDNVENPPWDDLDTPESPPMFEKEGYGDPVEYHDTSLRSGAVDVDQRVIPGMGDLDILEDSLSSLGGKDVDHRNLISLTGSPNVDTLPNGINPPNPLPARGNLTTITTQDSLWDNLDRDYRTLMGTNPSPPVEKPLLPSATQNQNADQDYRLQFGLDGLNLPPPPPPPPKSPQIDEMPPPLPPPSPAALPPLVPPAPSADPRTRSNNKSPKNRDLTLTDDVDMDLSDDVEQTQEELEDETHLSLEPPPPLPDLLDDVDANQFLDEISNDLNEFSNLSSELNVPEHEQGEHENGMMHHHMDEQHMDHPGDMEHGMWGGAPPPLGPPPMGFGMGPPMGMGGPPGLPPPPGYVTGMNRMDMMPPHPPGLLPAPGPPMPPLPQPPHWMDTQSPSWMPQNNMPPFDDNFDNPYPHNEGEQFEFDDISFVDFRNNRGGHNNFRGGSFNNSFNNKNENHQGFRGGRGRGRGGGNRGGRGNNRGGGRGKNSFKPRGNFRGRFNRGGF